jgi:hypothetical protein
MNTAEILDPESWAKSTFGTSQLKDSRRTARAVKVATQMAENPSASLPAQMQTWKETIALYRLLDEADVTRSGADAPALAPDPCAHTSRGTGPLGAGYDDARPVRP